MDFEIAQPLLEQLTTYWTGFIKLLPQLGMAVVTILLTWITSKIVSTILGGILKSARIRRALVDLVKTVSSVFVWVFGILIASAIVFPSITPGSVLASLGVAGVAIGFAFRDIFENFMAGIMIMLREPMRIGDFVECEGVEGRIEEITIRDTFIRQTDSQLILMPNSTLFKNPVYIRTQEEERRFEIIVGVGYGEDVDNARSIILDAVEAVAEKSSSKPVQVFAREFNSSSIDFTVRWWSGSEPIDFHESRDKVIASIKKALDNSGIEIPYPYRTLTFNQPVSILNETS